MLTRFSAFFLTFLLLIICVLFIGCTSKVEYPNDLLAIDSIMTRKPDSALILLSDIEQRMEHETEPVRCYYQLLTIKARDKAFLPHSSDSLILALLHYYENGGDPRLLPEAYYYAGRVTSDLGDAPQATDYYHKALDAINDEDYDRYRKENVTSVLRLKGRIYAQNAKLLVLQNFFDAAIPEYQQALTCDSLINDTTGLITDFRNLGHALLQVKRYGEAFCYFEKSQKLALELRDTIRYTNARIEEINALIEIEEWERANSIAEQITMKVSPTNNSYILSTLANLACRRGDEEKAFALYSSLLTRGSLNARINAHHWLANHALSKNQPQEAILLQNKAIQLYDSLQAIQNDASVSYAQSFYNYQLRERENQKLKANEKKIKLRMSLAICASLCLLLLSVHRFRKERRKRIEAANQYLQIKYLLEAKEQEAATTKAINDERLTRLRRSDAMALVDERIRQKKALTDSDWEVIERGIITYLPDFLRDLHSVHTYNQKERQMSILIKMDVTPTNIACLLCLTTSAIYHMRKRLFEKVFTKTCPYEDWEDFVKSL